MADTHAAAVNFLNALERIPTIIKQYEEKNEVLEREIPQLREIAGKTWKKEDELKQLKSELAALDRKRKRLNTGRNRKTVIRCRRRRTCRSRTFPLRTTSVTIL